MQIGPDPSAKVQGWRLDQAVLYDRHLNDIAHRRSADLIASGFMDHFTLTLLLEGEVEYDWDGHRRTLSPGEMIFSDVRVPGSNQARRAHLITLSMARNRLAAVTNSVGSLHGTVLSAPDARLLRDFLVSLVCNLPSLSKTAIVPTTKVLFALLRITLSGHGRPEVSERTAQRLEQLRLLIAKRLHDPDFDVDAVVQESGISRATLYRLVDFKGGLASFIRFQRLEEVRRRLSDRSNHAPFNEIALAAGFTNSTQAAQLFEEYYDIRPAAYRSAVLSAANENSASELMRLWQYEVRSGW